MIIIRLKYMPVCCSPDIEAECEKIISDNIAMWCIEKTFYGDEELLMHEKIWNILNLDKEGRRKEHSFVNWCIRIAGHRLDGFGSNSDCYRARQR